MKTVKTNTYEIRFNPENGYEELEGINGNPDPFVLEYPSLIDIGIMGNCQNKCEYCYQGDNYQEHMTLDNFKKIIDESKDYVMQVALGGRGNPNKHPQFREILKYCRDNGVVPNYTTSGIDLTEEEVEITKEYAGAVAVSMHRMDYTWRALEMFMSLGIPTNIHYVVSNHSIREAFSLIIGSDPWDNKVDLNKLHAIIFLLFKKQGRGLILEDWIVDKYRLTAFADLVANYDYFKKYNFMIGMDSCMVNKLLKSGVALSDEQMQSIDSCEGARMSCYISPDMKFMPCSFGGKLKGESLLNRSIKDIWDNGIEFKNFRDCLYKDPASCPYEL